MMTGLALRIEGRRGSPRRLCEGGRYLGIPRNGHLRALRDGPDGVDDHNCGLLSVQETGCGTFDAKTFPGLVGEFLRATVARKSRPASP